MERSFKPFRPKFPNFAIVINLLTILWNEDAQDLTYPICRLFRLVWNNERPGADLKKRMKDADPKVIGTRIVNKFLVTPHTRFGNPRAEKAPNYVTYPDACTWLGALWFSKAVKNKDMQQRLKERFEPLFTTEKNMLPRMVHVDYNVVGLFPSKSICRSWATGNISISE